MRRILWVVLLSSGCWLSSGCSTLAGYESQPAVGPDAGSDGSIRGSGLALTLEGPKEISGGTCRGPYVARRQDAQGAAVRSAGDTVVRLSVSGRGTLYRDAQCTIVIDAVTILSNTAASSFHYKAPLGESAVLVAADATDEFAQATLGVRVEPTLLAVDPAYPQHGAAWNSYVKQDGEALFEASDVPCEDPEEPCLHGGELRQAILVGVDGCSGLESGDDLGVFEWSCRADRDQGRVLVFSTGLRRNKGLRHLLAATLWRPNRLVVRLQGAIVAASKEEVWWSNPVESLPHNSTSARIVLDEQDDDGDGPDRAFSPGTIFIVNGERASNGFNIDLDGIGLVSITDSTLHYAGSGDLNCHEITAEATGQYDSRSCLIASGSQRFLWIEGSFDGWPVEPGGKLHTLFNLYRVSHSVLRHVAGRQASNGIVLRESVRNRMVDVEMDAMTNMAFQFDDAHDNNLEGVRLLRSKAGLLWGESDRNVLVNVHIQETDEASLYMGSGTENLFNGLTGIGSQALAALTVYGHRNRFVDVRVHNNRVYGLYVGGDYNDVVGVTATNNGHTGVRVSCSWRNPKGNSIVGIVAANNDHSGVAVNEVSGFRPQANTISHVTAVGNGVHGVSIIADESLVHQVVAINNGDSGLQLSGQGITVFDLVSEGNDVAEVDLRYAANCRFRGRLMVGESATPCKVTGGHAPGLLDGTCTVDGNAGSDYGSEVSDAEFSPGVQLDGAFVGRVMVDDPVNTTDTHGTANAVDIDDWSGFANMYRFWGLDTSTSPNDASGGRCQATTCRIWDLRLRDQTSSLWHANGVLTSGAACPPGAHGDDVITDASAFLANATEVLFDGRGNDDGLCETDEACRFSPHIGAYQGAENPRTAACQFEDGVVSHVALYGSAAEQN